MPRSGSVSPEQRYQAALAAGFNQGEALVMVAISYLECQDCEMTSVNATGDIGVWQINRVHWGSSDPTRSQYGDLTDPAVSAKAARAVFVGAGGDANPAAGYRQWCTYPGGCNGASPTSQSTFDALVKSIAAAIVNPNPPAIVGGVAPGGGTYPPATTPPPGTPQDVVDPCATAGQAVIATLPGGGQIRAGAIGEAMCRIGHAVAFFERPGTWWAVLLFGGALAAVVAGFVLYSKGEFGLGTLHA